MSSVQEPHLHLEVGHILFLDIVGYSKLLSDEQKELVQELNQIVRETEQFRAAEAEGKLTRLPTGDGMVLVFTNNPEAPVECALEISKALQSHPKFKLRMGIHSGPVNPVADVNDQSNLAGAGINVAERVMSCGDAGHILLSKHFAEDLEHYAHWRSYLHDVGTVAAKHGTRIPIVNLYTDQLGNSALPAKLRQARAAFRFKSAAVAALLLIAVLGIGFWTLRRSQEKLMNVVAAIPDKSIAVLPFENLSEDKANAFFADGVMDEILTDLARISDLKVISRTSVTQYRSGIARNLPEIGQQLGVSKVVEGSVQRSGNRVRVNAQLIDAPTDRHLWGQTYDRDLADVFAVQSEIAKTIADQLQAKLSSAEQNAIAQAPTTDITAFDLYARAKNLLLTQSGLSMTGNSLLQTVDLLDRAVGRDPSFFGAYCELAKAHDLLYFYGFDHSSARLALEEAAIQAAFRLRPDAGETHLALALNFYHGYLDYDSALAELELARQGLPNSPGIFLWTAAIRWRQGRWEESIRNFERAIELDPRNVYTLQETAIRYHDSRHYDREKSLLDRVLTVVPNDVITRAARASVEFDSKGDIRLLHDVIDSVATTQPGTLSSAAAYWFMCALAERDTAAANTALIVLGENPRYLGVADNVVFSRAFAEGVIARMTNQNDKARLAFTVARAEQEKVVQAEPNYAEAVCVLGLIDAALGRKEEALREGRRAVELLPVKKDAFAGNWMVKYLAMIAAWVGDKDLACEQLASAIRRPSDLSYGQLKLLPYWDPLRGDPRFEKILEESKNPVVPK